MAAGSERWGNYVLEERIASGGMAEVFRAHRVGAASFSRQVCVKRLHAHLCKDPEFIELFLDEARTGAKLRHRNLVAIDDLGEHDGRYFLAMEYVNGADLSHVEQRALSAGAPVPVDAAVFVMGEVLAGLHAAHTALDPDTRLPLRVVHRDVSPHNVLVSFGGEVKLADLGIARAEGRSRVTSGGIVRGKFGYMPLEQSNGEQVDGRTDLFALGVTAFELLAGRRPFRGEDPDATFQTIIAAQATDDRPTIHSLRPDLPPALAEIIETLLAVKPEDRYPDAASTLEALHAVPGMASGGVALAQWVARLYPGHGSVAFVPRASTPSLPQVIAPAIKRVQTTPFVLSAVKPRVWSAPADSSAPSQRVAPSAAPFTSIARVVVGDVPTPPRSSSRSAAWVLGGAAVAMVAAIGLVASGRRAASSMRSPAAVRGADAAPIARAVIVDASVALGASANAVAAAAPDASLAAAPETPAPEPEPRRRQRDTAATHAARDAGIARTVRADAATAPSASATGTLRVVIPWGEVSIDGRSQGIVRGGRSFTVAPGDHTLRVTGAVQTIRPVHVNAGEVRIVELGF